MKNILVLCTDNSCRSQIAHGYLALFGKEKCAIYSAGIETHGLNQIAVKIMQEDGVDIGHHTSNHIDEYRNVPFDFVITVCDHAKEHCPYFPTNAKKTHHNFLAPSKIKGTETEVLQAFRTTREEIKQFAEKFIAENL